MPHRNTAIPLANDIFTGKRLFSDASCACLFAKSTTPSSAMIIAPVFNKRRFIRMGCAHLAFIAAPISCFNPSMPISMTLSRTAQRMVPPYQGFVRLLRRFFALFFGIINGHHRSPADAVLVGVADNKLIGLMIAESGDFRYRPAPSPCAQQAVRLQDARFRREYWYRQNATRLCLYIRR